MNKRVEKPKRGVPLPGDGGLSDARLERFLRENRSLIDSELQSAKQAIDRGEARPLESLPELLKIVRKAHKPQR
jgi:hypothetical protein